MRRLFISYARENKRDVEELVAALELMGYETWVDSKLRGGQDWWEEILRRIADSDVFIAVISRAALNSNACQREFDWAEVLSRTVLPVAIEPLPAALPRRLASRQIIQYSERDKRERAAMALQGSLATVPTAPPLPDPLPEPPAAPLSYLTDLMDLVTNPRPIGYALQRNIVQQVSTAVRSVDREERRGGQDVLARLASRADLDGQLDSAILRLQQLAQQRAPSTRDVPTAADEALSPKAPWRRRPLVTSATLVAVVLVATASFAIVLNHGPNRTEPSSPKPPDDSQATLPKGAPTTSVRYLTDDWSPTIEIDGKIDPVFELQVAFKNTTGERVDSVLLTLVSPPRVRPLPGTTLLKNGTNPDALAVSDSLTTASGINIGDYNPDAAAYVRISLMLETLEFPCGKTTILFRSVARTNTTPDPIWGPEATLVYNHHCSTPS